MMLVRKGRQIVMIAALLLVAALLIYVGFELWGVVGVVGLVFALGILFVMVRFYVESDLTFEISYQFFWLRLGLRQHWQTIIRWVLYAAGIIAALSLVISLYGGYRYGWRWTGIVEADHFPKRTLWNWLQLLFIPAVLAGGGLWFNAQQKAREQRIANERAQDDALEAYLDQMSQFLTGNERPSLKVRLNDSLRAVARARTLTVLMRLDGGRKQTVVQFLYEAGLIAKDCPVLDLSRADLSEADLWEAHLSDANLSDANLSGAYLNEARLWEANLSDANLGSAILVQADLSGVILSGVILESVDLSRADLRRANLRKANLREANLRGADLSSTILVQADLSGANLSEAHLWEANLSGADLSGVNLSEANLSNAKLREAALSGANLSGAGLLEANLTNATLTEGQLATSESLYRATMPNGQKYEDWLRTSEGQLWITKGTSAWLKTPEGQLWLNEGIENVDYWGGIGSKYLDWLETPEGQNWLKSKASGDDGENSGPS